MNNGHSNFQVPTEPHAKKRYKRAMKHVEAAKKAGKSSEEIHAIFKKVMEFNPKNYKTIPDDVAHKKYKTALLHYYKAVENGKTPSEAHIIFKKIMNNEASGHCKA